ncbi:unnamed protein product [Rotaria sordida]|uniref:Uncharacterized protein n=1 Tax=Rotaria sordida TaxID=392033 RepID=A0A820FKU8_9BILA|nr:unnamed protein product [Rotaria sordida]
MASTATQIITKRSTKPKAQYSPSSPTVTAKYHLVIYNDTKSILVVGNSSAKRIANDGIMKLNDGRIAKLIIPGIKEECIEHWSKRIRPSRTNKSNDEQLQDDDNDDELPDMIERTLQMPGNTFQHLRI